jgi:predicted PurR-regulated permease PerM
MNKGQQKILENMWMRVILTGVSLIVFLFLCYILRGTLISLLLAFIFAFIFNPVVNFFERRHWPFSRKHISRGFAIAFLIIAVLLSTFGFLAFVIPKTGSEIYRLGTIAKEHYPMYLSTVDDLLERYGNGELVRLVRPFIQGQIEMANKPEEREQQEKQEITNGTESPEMEKRGEWELDYGPEHQIKKEIQIQREHLTELIMEYKKYLPQAMGVFFRIIREVFYGTYGFFSIIINFLVFSVVSIYLLKDFNILSQIIKNIFPLPVQDKAMSLLSTINYNLRYYLRGQAITCLILSFIYSIGLTIAGIDLAFVLGFIGGFGNFIPYVGTGIGLVLSIAIAFFEYRDFKHIFYVLMIYGVGQTLESFVITPRIMKRGLSLNPIVVILSVLIFGQLWGFLGLLLAIPMVAILKVFFDELISKYKSSKYYTG